MFSGFLRWKARKIDTKLLTYFRVAFLYSSINSRNSNVSSPWQGPRSSCPRRNRHSDVVAHFYFLRVPNRMTPGEYSNVACGWCFVAGDVVE